jgi:hypothetical protein
MKGESMAERHEDIDALFRDQLAGHVEKPSPEAWKKLEGKLHSEKKGLTLPWMKIAASLFFALGLISLLWWSIRSTEREWSTVAQKDAVPQNYHEPAVNKNPVQEVPVADEKNGPSTPDPVSPTAQRVNRKLVNNNQKAKESRPEIKAESKPIQPELEVETIELPTLETELAIPDHLIAEADIQETDEVAYTVTIISNGLRVTPEKETLVEEIEEKIDRLGGLITKVDQGFADLQDAKNGLFASITAKKESNNN